MMSPSQVIKDFEFGKFTKKVFPVVLKVILILILIISEGIVLTSVYRNSKEIIRLKAEEIWPSSFDPIARFVVNIDWDTRKVTFDASPTRTYKNIVSKYIWRIDDGTGLIGESQFEHNFATPGYYRVHLSVLDSNGQSDFATCTIFFAPEEIDKVETGRSQYIEENFKEGEMTGTRVKEETTLFSWIPKGDFMNYSKYLENNIDKSDSAILLSNYIENECGFSERPYNISTLSQRVSDNNSQLAKSSAKLIASVALAVGIVGIYSVSSIVINKSLSPKIEKE